MPKFTVTSPLQHDGKAYAEGDTLTLSDESAAPLLAAATIEPAGAARKPRAAAEPEPTPELAPAPSEPPPADPATPE